MAKSKQEQSEQTSPNGTTETTTGETEQLTIDGLALSIVQLRKELKEDRTARAEWMSSVKLEVARLKESVQGCHNRVDTFAEQWMASKNEMTQARQQAGDDLKAAGRLSRDMTEKAAALEEIRRNTPDPAVYLRPIRTELGQLKADLQALVKGIDVRFEQLPIRRSRPLEERGEGPSMSGKTPAR